MLCTWTTTALFFERKLYQRETKPKFQNTKSKTACYVFYFSLDITMFASYSCFKVSYNSVSAYIICWNINAQLYSLYFLKKVHLWYMMRSVCELLLCMEQFTHNCVCTLCNLHFAYAKRALQQLHHYVFPFALSGYKHSHIKSKFYLAKPIRTALLQKAYYWHLACVQFRKYS